jgi:hypothetical protein
MNKPTKLLTVLSIDATKLAQNRKQSTHTSAARGVVYHLTTNTNIPYNCSKATPPNYSGLPIPEIANQ